MTEKNVCIYKSECRNCTLVEIEDRPEMCKSIECDKYTPCKKCSRNLILNDRGVCKYCKMRTAMEDEAPVMVTNEDGVSMAVPQYIIDEQNARKTESNDTQNFTPIAVSVTRPGTPPTAYSDDEKQYYMDQWKEYAGYYRDPTAYALIHQIIIFEIEMNWIASYMIQTRGEYNQSLDNSRERIVKNLKSLRDQLPEKEASDLSDDEKAISMIYESYLEEKGNRELGGVRRLFTEDAVALAPRLHFPIDLDVLLQRAGFRSLDVVEVVEQFEGPPEDPMEIAEFFGFRLHDKFALSNNKSERDELEDDDGKGDRGLKTDNDFIFDDDELDES